MSGIIMKNGIPYGNGDNTITCTQAEYDAWEQAGTLQQNVTYYITDAPADTTIRDTLISTDTTWSSSKISGRKLIDLPDVTVSTPAVGDTLNWNGTNWVNGGVTNLAYATKNTDYVDSANSSYIAYVKFGRVVSIAYTFTTIALSNRYSKLFINLPKPVLPEMQISGEGVTPLRLASTGVIENVYTTSGNSFFRGSFTYLSSDA